MSPKVSYREILDSEARSAHLELSSSIKEKLVRYCDELTRWNEKINLTGLCGVDLVRRLVIEPIWIAQKLEISGIVVDIGSGNGSPSIPLSITQKLETIHLVEVRTRRTAFLRHVSSLLRLPDVRVHQGLFEEVAQEIGQVDWVTLQAVTPTKDLCRAIRTIAKPSANVVWITSSGSALAPKQIISEVAVSFTNTRALVLNLADFC